MSIGFLDPGGYSCGYADGSEEMQTHKIKGEDHYQCREVKAERDAYRDFANELAEALDMELEYPNTGPGHSTMREVLKRYAEFTGNSYSTV